PHPRRLPGDRGSRSLAASVPGAASARARALAPRRRRRGGGADAPATAPPAQPGRRGPSAAWCPFRGTPSPRPRRPVRVAETIATRSPLRSDLERLLERRVDLPQELAERGVLIGFDSALAQLQRAGDR